MVITVNNEQKSNEQVVEVDLLKGYQQVGELTTPPWKNPSNTQTVRQPPPVLTVADPRDALRMAVQNAHTVSQRIEEERRKAAEISDAGLAAAIKAVINHRTGLNAEVFLHARPGPRCFALAASLGYTWPQLENLLCGRAANHSNRHTS